MNRNIPFYLIAVFVLFGTSGCVRESSDGETLTVSYQLWVPVSVLLGGLVAAPIGWILHKKSIRFGRSLLILGPLAAVFFAPSLFRDRAVLDDESFSLRTGIWGMTAVHEIEFDELNQVTITEEERRRRGRKSTNTYRFCSRKDGTNAKIPLNNQVSKSAAPILLERLAKFGVPIEDHR